MTGSRTRLVCAALMAAILAAPGPAALAQTGAGDPGAAGPNDASRPRPSLPAPPRPRFLDIDWQSVREELKRARTEGREVVLKLAPQELLKKVRLPVLVPDLKEMRNEGRVFPQRDFYSATLTLPKAVIEIYGTRIAAPLPEEVAAAITRRAMPDAEGLRVQETETGIEVSFQRFRASYNISVACDDPAGDERCKAASFVRDLAGRMAIAGGEEGQDGEEQ